MEGDEMDPEKEKEGMNNEQDPPSQIEQLKSEFRDEFEKWKESIKKEMEEKDAKIKELTENNDQLRSALIREATAPKIPEPPKKTEEDIYREEVAASAEKALKLVKEEVLGQQK